VAATGYVLATGSRQPPLAFAVSASHAPTSKAPSHSRCHFGPEGFAGVAPAHRRIQGALARHTNDGPAYAARGRGLSLLCLEGPSTGSSFAAGAVGWHVDSSTLGETPALATIRKRAFGVPRHGGAGAPPRSMGSEGGRPLGPPVLDVPRALEVVLGIMDQLIAGVVIALGDRARMKQSRVIGAVT
jgi:hypothetical protein